MEDLIMKRTYKKLLAFLLAVLQFASFIPVGSFADEPLESTTQEIIVYMDFDES